MISPEKYIRSVLEDQELFFELWNHFEGKYKQITSDLKRDKMITMALSFTLGRIYGQEEIKNGKRSILDESLGELQE